MTPRQFLPLCVLAVLVPTTARSADYTIKAGSTNVSVYFVMDTNNNPDFVNYIRDGEAVGSLTAGTELAQMNSAYSVNQWKIFSPGAGPDLVRYDLPDAVVAQGASSVVLRLITAEQADHGTIRIDLVGYDPTASALPANVTQLGGSAQSATDLQDFADAGYDPAGNAVTLVYNVDATAEVSGAVGEIAAGGITASSFATGAIDNGAFSVTENLNANVTQFGGINGTFSGGRPEVIIQDNGITDSKVASTAAVKIADSDRRIILSDTLGLGSSGTNLILNGVWNGSPPPLGSTILVYDASAADMPCVRRVVAFGGDTIDIDSPLDFTPATGDKVRIFATPNQLPSAAPGASGGLFIAGSNADTTVNFAGNLSGSVGSVTGAVGSVTGNVGGNIVGSVASISGVTFPANFGGLTITSGRINADVTHWLGTGVTTNVNGVPKVDITHVLGDDVCE